jgi:hypothetical protein
VIAPEDEKYLIPVLVALAVTHGLLVMARATRDALIQEPPQGMAPLEVAEMIEEISVKIETLEKALEEGLKPQTGPCNCPGCRQASMAAQAQYN